MSSGPRSSTCWTTWARPRTPSPRRWACTTRRSRRRSKSHYSSHRTVNPGLNYMGSDVYELNADGVYNSSTVASVCAQLAETAANKGWRIFVFHDFTTASTSNTSLLYPIHDFEGILQCAQNTAGLEVVTVREGANRLRCASP